MNETKSPVGSALAALRGITSLYDTVTVLLAIANQCHDDANRCEAASDDPRESKIWRKLGDDLLRAVCEAEDNGDQTI
jgi:hypothetical protein